MINISTRRSRIPFSKLFWNSIGAAERPSRASPSSEDKKLISSNYIMVLRNLEVSTFSKISIKTYRTFESLMSIKTLAGIVQVLIFHREHCRMAPRKQQFGLGRSSDRVWYPSRHRKWGAGVETDLRSLSLALREEQAWRRLGR